MIDDCGESLTWLHNPEEFAADLVASHEVDLPSKLQRWIDLDSSMTQAIAVHQNAAVSVEVCFAGCGITLAWEQGLLQDTPPTEAQYYIRHVILHAGTQPCLVARSVAVLDGDVHRRLSDLNSLPLGSVLFEDNLWQRCYPHNLGMGMGMGMGVNVLVQKSGLVGRLCAWQHRDYADKLLVEEFFLPHLYNCSG